MSASKKKKPSNKKQKNKNSSKPKAVKNNKNIASENIKKNSENKKNTNKLESKAKLENTSENKSNEKNIKDDENLKTETINKSSKKNKSNNANKEKNSNSLNSNINVQDSKNNQQETIITNKDENVNIQNVNLYNENQKIEPDEKNKDNKKNSKKRKNAQNKDESLEGNKKNDKKIEQSELIKTNEKPEYVQEMIRKRKKEMYILICIIGIILVLIMISTFFAIFNSKNTNIIKGISIKNIDVSDLSREDARNRITEATNKELIAEIDLKYGNEYQITIKPEQIEFKYDIEDAVENAYSIARTPNIVENNYTLLFTSFFGKNIDINYSYNGDLLNQFVEDINSKIPGVVIEPTYYIEDGKLIVNKGTDGIQVKKEELKQQILEKIIIRKASEMISDEYKQTIEIPIEEVKASQIDIEKIYSDIYRKPQDAYYETTPYKIYPDVDGIDLAISIEDAKKIIASENKEEYSFDLKITKAEKTIDDLGTEAFPYLISSFSTKYDASNRNRSTNLQLAAHKINGKVLMPGEEFSFNKIVGKRTVEDGYREAKIYADGGVVDGLAGGICQISSTLYNAVIFANLQVTERRNHTYTTSYVAAGRDATVVWGTTDFRFINSRSYPIKIEATVNNGIAEFKIHGMQEETEYEVRILPVTTQSLPYTTSYVEDITLLPGQQIISQSGHAGYKVTTYKELRLNGAVVSKEVISNDTYSPMRTIIKIGPGTPIQ